MVVRPAAPVPARHLAVLPRNKERLAAPARGLAGPAVQEISVAQAHRLPVAAPQALPPQDAALPALKVVRELRPGLRDAQRERRASELAAL
jgi:hypothetical protein